MSVIQIPTSSTGFKESIIRDARAAQAAVNRIQMTPQLNPKGMVQPLGKITNAASEFQKSMDASAARVFAFGAAVGVINGISEAFKGMVLATAQVEKSLKDIQVVMEVSNQAMKSFGDGLFDVARNTATSLKDVAESATELARQGLSAEETLARVNSALILSRLSGLDAVKSTETLTAAINSFNKEGITHEQIVNRMANVDAAFAVSSADLAEAISRAGAVAQSSGVSFNQLSAVITAVQQRTARGGSVIGNGFKSIFTRIKRSGVREALEEIGVATKNLDGSFRSGMDVILDYANVYKTLTDSQKAYTSEQLAGVYQIQNLQALLQDLNSGFSVYNKALGVANNTTNEAVQRNEQLNTTLDALFKQTTLSSQELAASIGDLAVSGNFKEILKFLDNLAQKLNSIFSEEGGSDVAKNLIRGIGSFLTGPGLVILGAAFIKIFGLVTKFAKEAFADILGLNSETKRQQSLQAAIGQILSSNAGIYQKILAAGSNTAKQEQIILNIIKQETAERLKQEALIKRIAGGRRLTGVGASDVGFVPMGKRPARSQGKKTLGMASGFLPAFSKESRDIYNGVGGARKSDSPVSTKIKMTPGKSEDVVVNTGEWIVRNYEGSGADAVFNRNMAKTYGLPSGAQKVNAASGIIPNFSRGGFGSGKTISYTARQLGASGSAGASSKISKYADLSDKFTGKVKVERMSQDNAYFEKKAASIKDKLIQRDPSQKDGRIKYAINQDYKKFLERRYKGLIDDGVYRGIFTSAENITKQPAYSGKQPTRMKNLFGSLVNKSKGLVGESKGRFHLARKPGNKNASFIKGNDPFDLSVESRTLTGKTKLKKYEQKTKNEQNIAAVLKKGASSFLSNLINIQQKSGGKVIGLKDGNFQNINLTKGSAAMFRGGLNMLVPKDTKVRDSAFKKEEGYTIQKGKDPGQGQFGFLNASNGYVPNFVDSRNRYQKIKDVLADPANKNIKFNSPAFKKLSIKTVKKGMGGEFQKMWLENYFRKGLLGDYNMLQKMGYDPVQLSKLRQHYKQGGKVNIKTLSKGLVPNFTPRWKRFSGKYNSDKYLKSLKQKQTRNREMNESSYVKAAEGAQKFQRFNDKFGLEKIDDFFQIFPFFSRGFVPNFGKTLLTSRGSITTQQINRLKDGKQINDKKTGEKLYLNQFTPEEQSSIKGFKATNSKEVIAQKSAQAKKAKNQLKTIDASRQATMLVATKNFKQKVDTTTKSGENQVRLKYRVEGIKNQKIGNQETALRSKAEKFMLNQAHLTAMKLAGTGQFAANTPMPSKVANAGSIGSAAGSIFETAVQSLGKNSLFTKNNATFDIQGFPDNSLKNLFGYYSPFADAKIGLTPGTKADFNKKLLSLPEIQQKITGKQRREQGKVALKSKKNLSKGYAPNFSKFGDFRGMSGLVGGTALAGSFAANAYEGMEDAPGTAALMSSIVFGAGSFAGMKSGDKLKNKYENDYKTYSSKIGNVTYDFYKKDHLEYNKLSKDINQRIRGENEKLISFLSGSSEGDNIDVLNVEKQIQELKKEKRSIDKKYIQKSARVKSARLSPKMKSLMKKYGRRGGLGSMSRGYLPNYSSRPWMSGKQFARFSGSVGRFNQNVALSKAGNMKGSPLKSPSRDNLFSFSRRKQEESLGSIKQYINSDFFRSLDPDIQSRVTKFYNKRMSNLKDNRPFEYLKDDVKSKARTMNFGKGYTPNYSNPLMDALSREKGALSARGISSSAIRVEQSSKLKNPMNPEGLAVTNKVDEPLGVDQGISRARKMGMDPKTHGTTPNFAAPLIPLLKPMVSGLTTAVMLGIDPLLKAIRATGKVVKKQGAKTMGGMGEMGAMEMGLMFGGPMMAEMLKNGRGPGQLPGSTGVITDTLEYSSMGALLGKRGMIAGAAGGAIAGLSRMSERDLEVEAFEKIIKQKEKLDQSLQDSQAIQNYATGVVGLNEALKSGDFEGAARAQNMIYEAMNNAADPELIKRMGDLQNSSKTAEEKLQSLNKEMDNLGNRASSLKNLIGITEDLPTTKSSGDTLSPGDKVQEVAAQVGARAWSATKDLLSFDWGGMWQRSNEAAYEVMSNNSDRDAFNTGTEGKDKATRIADTIMEHAKNRIKTEEEGKVTSRLSGTGATRELESDLKSTQKLRDLLFQRAENESKGIGDSEALKEELRKMQSTGFEFGAIGDKVKEIATWDIDVTDKINVLDKEIENLGATIQQTSKLIGMSQEDIQRKIDGDLAVKAAAEVVRNLNIARETQEEIDNLTSGIISDVTADFKNPGESRSIQRSDTIRDLSGEDEQKAQQLMNHLANSKVLQSSLREAANKESNRATALAQTSISTVGNQTELEKKSDNTYAKVKSQFEQMQAAQKVFNEMQGNYRHESSIRTFDMETKNQAKRTSNDYMTSRGYLSERGYEDRDSKIKKDSVLENQALKLNEQLITLAAGYTDMASLFDPTATQRSELNLGKESTRKGGIGQFEDEEEERLKGETQEIAQIMRVFAQDNKDGNITLSETKGVIEKLKMVGEKGNLIGQTAYNLARANGRETIAQLQRISLETLTARARAASNRLENQGASLLTPGQKKATTEFSVEGTDKMPEMLRTARAIQWDMQNRKTPSLNPVFHDENYEGETVGQLGAEAIDAFRKLADILGVNEEMFTGMNRDMANYIISLENANEWFDNLKKFDPESAEKLKPIFERLKANLDKDLEVTQSFAGNLKNIAEQTGKLNPSDLKDPIDRLNQSIMNKLDHGVKITDMEASIKTPLESIKQAVLDQTEEIIKMQPGGNEGGGEGEEEGEGGEKPNFKDLAASITTFSESINKLADFPKTLMDTLSELTINHEVTGGIKFDFNSDVVRGQLTPVMMQTLKTLLQDGVILDYLANALAPRIQLKTQTAPTQ